MLPGRQYTPADVGRIAWRGKWLILGPTLLAAAATGVALMRMPDIYRSETTILVVPQRVSDTVVRSTVTSRIQDRLQSISQQIMSRSRLEPIIMEFALYEGMRQRMPMEDVVERMRRDVDVQTVRGDAFVLRYTSTNPDTARRVTERLASLFIEENVRDREVLADATNQFLDSQLEEARGRLIENEKRLEEYRTRHAGELPTQASSNLQAMQNLQMQVQNLNESLARDRDRRQSLERALADLQPASQPSAASGATPAPARPATSATEDDAASGSSQQQLDAMRQALATMRTRFTPEHPDVVRAERIVRELEVKVAQEQKAAAGRPAAGTPGTPVADRRAAALRDEVAQIARDVTTKERQLSLLEGQIGAYRSRLDAAPARESEMTELMRDYETIRKVYTDLLAKREDSKVAANLERRQIGEQFRVLDPARRPERPFSPNRQLIASGGLGLGLVLGLLLVAGLELKNKTFRREDDVVGALALPVLATVPHMRNTAERLRRLRAIAGASAAGVVLIAGAAAAAWRWWR